MGPQHMEEVERPGQRCDAEAGGRERKQESGFLGLGGLLLAGLVSPSPPATPQCVLFLDQAT